jgi:hypothetical protein
MYKTAVGFVFSLMFLPFLYATPTEDAMAAANERSLPKR